MKPAQGYGEDFMGGAIVRLRHAGSATATGAYAVPVVITHHHCHQRRGRDGPLDCRLALSGGFCRLSESVSHGVLSRSKWTVSGIFRVFDWLPGGSVVKIS